LSANQSSKRSSGDATPGSRQNSSQDWEVEQVTAAAEDMETATEMSETSLSDPNRLSSFAIITDFDYAGFTSLEGGASSQAHLSSFKAGGEVLLLTSRFPFSFSL